MRYVAIVAGWVFAAVVLAVSGLALTDWEGLGQYRDGAIFLALVGLAPVFGWIAWRGERFATSKAATKVEGRSVASIATPPTRGWLSVFVSYGGPDLEVATELVTHLESRGVDVWFFPKSATAGELLSTAINSALFERDRVLVLCSRRSLLQPGVVDEIGKALARETKEGRSNILVPVLLDDYLRTEWKPTPAHLRDSVLLKTLVEIPPPRGETRFDEQSLETILRCLRST